MSSAFEAFGTAINVLLALVLIFGGAGFPELGIVGAGVATVAGSWASALLACGLFLRRRYRAEFGTIMGWRPERELMGRLLRFGGPAGVQVFLDVFVFHLFTQLVGRLGDAAMGATTLTVRLNMVAFLPMMGLAQAISILVGQRLGADQPGACAEKHLHGPALDNGLHGHCRAIYITVPHLLVSIFEGDRDPEDFAAIAALIPTMLLCVACFSLARRG